MSREHDTGVKIRQYIEAQTGYFLLKAYLEEDGKMHVHKRCIIAWGLEESQGCTSTIPVTLEGMVLENLPVLLPCGFIEVPHDCDWDNLDEWLAFEKKKAIEKQGRNAK
jgi:hypothetical protein